MTEYLRPKFHLSRGTKGPEYDQNLNVRSLSEAKDWLNQNILCQSPFTTFTINGRVPKPSRGNLQHTHPSSLTWKSLNNSQILETDLSPACLLAF